MLDRHSILVLAFSTLAFSSVTAAHTDERQSQDAAKDSIPAVSISGEVETPYTARLEDLKKMPVKTIKDLPIVCRSGATKDTFKISKGTPIKALLDKGKPKLPGHFDANHAYVVVTASDGYKVVFSWNELYNTDIGDDVVLIYERDGKPVSAKEGPLVLVSGKDRTTGPRHVRNTQNIEIRLLK